MLREIFQNADVVLIRLPVSFSLALTTQQPSTSAKAMAPLSRIIGRKI